jgi:hypothetical protein
MHLLKHTGASMKIKYHHDAGHGWYAVKKAALEQSGVANKISSYSYQRGNTVYLEEDSDAPKFFRAIDTSTLEVTNGKFQSRSPIRSYQPYVGADHETV